MASHPALDQFCQHLQLYIRPYAGRVEYGNLRSKIADWDAGNGHRTTNVAIVYETPGGSTDQINVSFEHTAAQFTIVEEDGEHSLSDPQEVILRIRPRVEYIPQKRAETIQADIRRQVAEGGGKAGLFGQLNRYLQSEFKGGTITHLEFRDAMTYAVQYCKSISETPE